ncbi:hypothetical protein [Occultella kanbiaonis]|uniref:hypothetical protein n=1 Tax=Occultella kanbiaonis TaxID=2675754 RepID=UPI0012B6B3CE|nr:hypothetical protein [Occultella kanbiaonis]
MPDEQTPPAPAALPPPRRTRSNTVRIVAMLLVLVIGVPVIGFTLIDLAKGAGDGPTVGSPSPPTGPTAAADQDPSSGSFTGSDLEEALNIALASRNRAAFFSHVEGAAVEPLNLWWDNMDRIGWSEGALSILGPESVGYADHTVTVTVTLGAAMTFSPRVPAGTDHPDAGLTYVQSLRYSATIRVTDGGTSGVISEWGTYEQVAPWDVEPLYVVQTEHAVIAGYQDESALVDRVATLAESAAAYVIDAYEHERGYAPVQRMPLFITEDTARFERWFSSSDPAPISDWWPDRSGTNFTLASPAATAGLGAHVATGGDAGGVVTIGPSGILHGDTFLHSTMAHEFAHTMAAAMLPDRTGRDPTVSEGWATFLEGRFESDGREFAPHGVFGNWDTPIGSRIRQCYLTRFTGRFPVDTDFVDEETSNCAYAIAATVYSYATTIGINAYALAETAERNDQTLPQAARTLGGPELDEAGWVAFVAEHWA